MKRFAPFIAAAALAMGLSGCAAPEQAQVAATTLPVYEFTSRLCEGTDISVTRLVTESVSCLHDYALNVRQVRAVEGAEMIVISGAGMEEFMEDLLEGRQTIDASQGIELLEPEEHDHGHGHEEESHEGHSHEKDPHIWLSPVLASDMAANICDGLTQRYPQFADAFEDNLAALQEDLDRLNAYGEEQLSQLSCREMITFHDGFGYFADAFDLTILRSIEEEAGSEASAKELEELIGLVREHQLPAIFTETNGSAVSAHTIKSETGVEVYALDMCMGNLDYFAAMKRNIDTVKEALG